MGLDAKFVTGLGDGLDILSYGANAIKATLALSRSFFHFTTNQNTSNKRNTEKTELWLWTRNKDAKRKKKRKAEAVERARRRHCYRAKLAKSINRNEDLVEALEKIPLLDKEFTPKEQKMLLNGYEALISERTESLSMLNTVDTDEERVTDYKKKIETELSDFHSRTLRINQREHFAQLAKLAEMANRPEETTDALIKLARLGVQLTYEQRELLSAAYQKQADKLRQGLRKLITDKEAAQKLRKIRRIEEYKAELESELRNLCNDKIKILNDNLIENSLYDNEYRAFFHKMKGDYLWYLAECSTGKYRKQSTFDCITQYEVVEGIFDYLKSKSHPLKIAAVLNKAIVYDEIKENRVMALCMANRVLKEVQEVQSGSSSVVAESANLIQSLKTEDKNVDLS